MSYDALYVDTFNTRKTIATYTDNRGYTPHLGLWVRAPHGGVREVFFPFVGASQIRVDSAHIHTYIYMCVCVCADRHRPTIHVCACAGVRSTLHAREGVLIYCYAMRSNMKIHNVDG